MLQQVINSKSERTEAHRIAALTTLLDVALRLAHEHDVDRIFNIVTQAACQALPCERASLFLLDPQRSQLYTRTVTELELREIRLPIDRGIIGWVARERAVACVNAPWSDERWDSSFDLRTGFSTRNILAVPVLSNLDGSSLGVLQLMNAGHAEFTRFDEHLAQAFAAQAAATLERARLQLEAQRAAELRRELEMARCIQRSFLPEQTPAIPGYELAAWWQPAEFVSGDYYDWFPLPDQRLSLVVGDVSGHGVHSSLIMASIRAMLRIVAKTTSEPARILDLLDEAIHGDLRDARFVSFLMVALDPATHHVKFANAGHAPAVHISPQFATVHPLAATRLPLGFPNVPVPVALTEFQMEPADLLVLGTDGVIEARNPAGELFGLPRLLDLLQKNSERTADELVQLVCQAVQAFHAQLLPADDTTLMILKRT